MNSHKSLVHEVVIHHKDGEAPKHKEFPKSPPLTSPAPSGNITPKQQAQLDELLTRYKDMFITDDDKLGYTETVKHKIFTTDNIPVNQPFQRIPPSQYQEAKEHIQKLLKRGIIRESHSPYSSPIMLVRDGKYRSRAHTKAEKRKQRKAWKKRNANERGENKEKPLIADVQEIPETEPPAKKKRNEQTLDRPPSRGTYLVRLSKLKYKHKNQTEKRSKPAEKMQQKIVDSAGPVEEGASAGNHKANHHVDKNVPASKIQSKRTDVGGTSASSKRIVRTVPHKIDRSLLKVDKTKKIGSRTFGNCYLAVYRNDFTVVVKEIKSGITNSPQQAREEVLREAAAIMGIGDHWEIPHLFGVCSRQAPYYLVLQYHALHNQSVTLFKATSAHTY